MAPIGVFDSGYGGLTVLKEFVNRMPDYDFLYLGDNARNPYGTRSFDTVYKYTKQCVRWMFDQGCPLVVLACNTASAKALRTIQQKDLPGWGNTLRILGVIRPTAEIIGRFTKTGRVGILATKGTVSSSSYLLEIQKFYPELTVFQQACPLWVPIIENGLQDSEGASFFIRNDISRLLNQNRDIDTILLGCTHYPLILNKIRQYVPEHIRILSQGEIVAERLMDYLDRHEQIKSVLSRTGKTVFYTTDATSDFDQHSTLFFGRRVSSEHLSLE